jgi:hypothetical protein
MSKGIVGCPLSSREQPYTPIGGASGFAATWDSTSGKPDPVEIEVQHYQDNGLSFINQTQHSTKDMKLDGQGLPGEGC